MTNGRREFIKNSGLVGIGLAIGFSINKAQGLFKVNTTLADHELTPFIVIRTDGTITLVNPNPDMGQGSTQAVPALIAEELEVDLDKVSVIQSDGNSKYGVQISGGSGSVRRGWEPLRKAGAAAKEMLLKAASQRWKLPVTECYAEKGFILNRRNSDKFSYGNLVIEASSYEVPQNPVLKAKKDFRIIGKMSHRPDVVNRVTGKAEYGIDVEVPGMLYAAILHSPTIIGEIVRIDDSEAKTVSGVVSIFKCERKMPHRVADAVAVVATSYWSALTARQRLKVTWDNKGDHISTGRYFSEMHEATKQEGLVHTDTGDFNGHYLAATDKLEAIYETPFAAHVPLEPECATVHAKSDGTVEVWAPVQAPDWARGDISKYLNIVPEKIRMNVTLLGGSFGRKAYHDFLLEACFISRKMDKPVKLIWTREDDVTQGSYRAGMLSHLQGTYKEKMITGFHHHAIGESIDGQVNNALKEGVADPVLCGEIDFKNSQYGFRAGKISYSRVTTDIPIVWWRSVYASNFSWGQECFIDELAHAAGIDPLKARMDLLKSERHRRVLEILSEKSNYGKNHGDNTGMGIAIWKSFESISAAAVFVTRVAGKAVIQKVVSVMDCGIYINPDNVRAQTEGNIVMGLTAAIKGGISFTKGKCDQTNYHQYNLMRIGEIPQMEIHLVENEEVPGGVGEPGLPPIAPALGNALFNLTGKRVRKLPIDLQNL